MFLCATQKPMNIESSKEKMIKEEEKILKNPFFGGLALISI
jgi:hypothetical protein